MSSYYSDTTGNTNTRTTYADIWLRQLFNLLLWHNTMKDKTSPTQGDKKQEEVKG